MASKSVRKSSKEERGEQVETPERILGAALRLFAAGGFGAVSLRDITAEARANIAAVNYHFGSKEGLVVALLDRHVRPVNRERLERLARLEREHGRAGMEATQVVEAFFAPVVGGGAEAGALAGELMQFMGRLLTERGYDLPAPVLGELREVTDRYVTVLGRLLPGLAKAELFWRLHFASGVLAHTLLHGAALRPFATNQADDPHPGEKLRRMVGFCAAGLTHGTGGGQVSQPAAAAEPAPRPLQAELF